MFSWSFQVFFQRVRFRHAGSVVTLFHFFVFSVFSDLLGTGLRFIPPATTKEFLCGERVRPKPTETTSNYLRPYSSSAENNEDGPPQEFLRNVVVQIHHIYIHIGYQKMHFASEQSRTPEGFSCNPAWVIAESGLKRM